MEIVSLKERKEHIPTLAEWHYKQWAYLHAVDSIERRIAEFEEEFTTEGIPRTFVAVSGSEVLGSASILPHDLETRMELTPWLASVFVAPDHRENGIGSALVRHVVREAAGLGYKILYLYTPDRPAFYARLGWSPYQTVEYYGHNVDIMTIDPQMAT